jgi:VanZ family protein
MKNTLPYLLPLYSLIIIILAVIPIGGELNKKKLELFFEFRLDYLAHLSVFAGFYIIYIITNFFGLKSQKFSILKLTVLAISLAIITETIQYFLPARSFNPYDMFFNLLGVVIGILIATTLRKIMLRKSGLSI